MNRLALLTPWPPQQSGIADYAFDLAKVLSRQGAELVVFTTEKSPDALPGVEFHTVDEDTRFDVLEQFDTLVYQLGNNTSFHLWMIPLLHDYPGIIHVHDLVMHHMVAWQTWLQGDTVGYLAVIERWHGITGRSAAEDAVNREKYLWDSDEIGQYPLSEEYLQEARAVIVHSQYALRHIRQTTPHVPSFQAPQLYDLHALKQPATALRNIAVLGGVDPQKRLDWVIDALANLKENLNRENKLTLHIAGNIDPRCMHLETRAKEISRAGLEIKFLGRVNNEQFKQLFLDADLCIALRFPTMGETSAIVSKALQYGVPTVVNDIGWYAELPGDIVKKIPVVDCQRHLGKLLEYLIYEDQAYERWAAHCRDYASRQFSLDDYAVDYLDICTNPLGEEKVSDIFASVLRECGMTGADEEESILQKIMDEAYF